MSGLIEPLKKTFSDLFSRSLKKINSDNNQFSLYRIVDSYTIDFQENYKVQCAFTKIILDLNLDEIVFDFDILHGLHPIQSCFVGMEYSKILDKKSLFYNQQKHVTESYKIAQYCTYYLVAQNRNGALTIEHRNSKQQFVYDAIDVALSRELIGEFNAADAFQIGVLAGLKYISNLKRGKEPSLNINHLRLVK